MDKCVGLNSYTEWVYMYGQVWVYMYGHVCTTSYTEWVYMYMNKYVGLPEWVIWTVSCRNPSYTEEGYGQVCTCRNTSYSEWVYDRCIGTLPTQRRDMDRCVGTLHTQSGCTDMYVYALMEMFIGSYKILIGFL